ncbi:alanyl-tRNA editing protein [Litoreibacter janthinus]|uniref:Alanine--tRNA ligase n=1 Tax=Litoreibacter janthinus TaxID=670154 RepID=A0A1I6H9H8_9RHOB|nr:alanyl-tRNA editing protein [Litoreibacter janthinus]SFR50967.1 Ala-tRNA(Pro) hydrolase [Litoreibacter janthinus]
MSLLFRDDAYMQQAQGSVLALSGQGIVLDRALFYPTGGGQPADTGKLEWDGGGCRIIDARKGDGEQVILVPEEGAERPEHDAVVTQVLDWDRRHAHMRIHTALHLLSVVIPLGVTGGQIGAEKGRLDFDMPEPPEDKAALEDELNALIARDLDVTEQWISDAELEANPGLVKTMSVQPPKGAGRVRLVRIGTEREQIDLQPCGGTHVARTSEIGRVRIGKIENKGRNNRRVHLHLDG